MTEREFAPSSAAPAQARRFAADTLARSATEAPAGFVDDVLLVVSELVTNAVRARSRTVRLDLDIDAAAVTVRVTDAATGWPQVQDAARTDTGGRGLALVAALAQAWGADQHEAGKTVWARLAVPV